MAVGLKWGASLMVGVLVPSVWKAAKGHAFVLEVAEDLSSVLKAVEDLSSALKAVEDLSSALKAVEDLSSALKAAEGHASVLKAAEDLPSVLKIEACVQKVSECFVLLKLAVETVQSFVPSTLGAHVVLKTLVLVLKRVSSVQNTRAVDR